MLAHEIVVREVQRDSRAQVFDPLEKPLLSPVNRRDLVYSWSGLCRAQELDSFPHYEGESPQACILTYTGRPTKKTHGDRIPSGRPVDFG